MSYLTEFEESVDSGLVAVDTGESFLPFGGDLRARRVGGHVA